MQTQSGATVSGGMTTAERAETEVAQHEFTALVVAGDELEGNRGREATCTCVSTLEGAVRGVPAARMPLGVAYAWGACGQGQTVAIGHRATPTCRLHS